MQNQQFSEDWRDVVHRAEVQEMMAAKIGGAFGTRRYPRIFECSANPRWWLYVAGPYKTRRAAFRAARKFRQQRPKVVFGVFEEQFSKSKIWQVFERKISRYKKHTRGTT